MVSFPKPTRRIVDRVKDKRARDAKAEAFRKAVWKRDAGKCRHCDRTVIHTLGLVPNAGHVHHRRGRRVAPEDRYNVARAMLLCGLCHGDKDVIARYRQ